MSLDVSLIATMPIEVFDKNITHNLTPMAVAAGIYKHLWRPEELGITKGEQLIDPLRKALNELRENPEKYEAHAPANGWGTYEGLISFVKAYLMACIEYPDADIEVSR